MQSPTVIGPSSVVAVRIVTVRATPQVVVECSPTFEEKLERTTDAILSIARDVQKENA